MFISDIISFKRRESCVESDTLSFWEYFRTKLTVTRSLGSRQRHNKVPNPPPYLAIRLFDLKFRLLNWSNTVTKTRRGMKGASPTVYRFDTCCFSGLKILSQQLLISNTQKSTKIAGRIHYISILLFQVKFSSECAPNTQTAFRVQPFIASHLPLTRHCKLWALFRDSLLRDFGYWRTRHEQIKTLYGTSVVMFW